MTPSEYQARWRAKKAQRAVDAEKRAQREAGLDDRRVPDAEEALTEPFWAFPSWFLRIKCDRCHKVWMLNEAHASDRQRGMLLRDLLARARHEGCGGRTAKAELVSNSEGVSSLPVRRIVLRGG